MRQPRTAAATLARSRKSPREISTRLPKRRCAFSGARQNTRTAAPRSRSRYVTCRPINPVPPVIRNCVTSPIRAESTSNVSHREVFFIADDFGMNAEVNRAVVEAHRRGVLQGASLMVGQPGTADAVRAAQDNPGLRVGWHLHLDNSQPVTCAAWPWGDSYRRAGWAIGLSRRARWLMREEVRAQWEGFRATGLACAFVNSHHHLHAHPFVYQILLD